MALPSLGAYHASKWALEGMTEALATEVAAFGIHTTLIEPGGYGTDWARASAARSEPNDLYTPIRDIVTSATDPAGRPGAEDTISAVLAVVDADDPPKRLILGSQAFDSLLQTYEQRVSAWREWEAVSRSADAI